MREKSRGRRDSLEAVLQKKVKTRRKKSLRVKIKERAVSKTLKRTGCRESQSKRRDNQLSK